MEGSQDPLLEGQKGKWTLHIANVGTAPATNVVLKTNMAWINIQTEGFSELDKENLDESKIGSLETMAKSYCVGPSGTLMRLPLQGSKLKQEGIILPGESLDIPLHVKAGVSGMQDFYMLYRYELYDPSSPMKTNPHRWLKKMYKIPVYPSLSIAASISPSSWSKTEHILSVEVSWHFLFESFGIMIFSLPHSYTIFLSCTSLQTIATTAPLAWILR